MPTQPTCPGQATPRASRGLVGILLVAALATGCGLTSAQREAVEQFSRATSTLGAQVADELVRMRQETIRMNTLLLRVEGAPAGTKPDLEEGFKPKDVAARLMAVATLKTYGDLLQALVSDTQEAQLREAGSAFARSVQGLLGAQRKLSDEQLGALGELVTAAGGWFLEMKKARAIEQIVAKAAPQIDELCDLLAADLDPTAAGKLAFGFLATTERLRAAAGVTLQDSKPGGLRDSAVEGYRLALHAKSRREEVHAAASRTLLALKKANADLLAALVENEVRLADIQRFATSVRALAGALAVLG